MSRNLQIGDLHPARDRPAVYAWLRSFLRWHLHTWSRAAGLPWTEAEIDAHIDQNGLVERDWNELAGAAEDADQLVAVAREASRAVGIVHAGERVDRYLQTSLGVVHWIFVEPVSRGQGVGDLLVQASQTWMRQRGLHAAEVFVTADNTAAARLYRRGGFALVDHRMIARLGGLAD
jgi:ribosomal protein S18 acetylase RimI-like enzyme